MLDYGIGNLRSAERALLEVGGKARLVSEPEAAEGAAGVVLPGVGSFGPCAAALRATGLDTVALHAIESGRPFLGICVGMQLLYSGSEEDPCAKGLSVFPGTVRALPAGTKRPQMQWNVVSPLHQRCSRMLPEGAPTWMYFVHSYAPEIGPETVATCDYGGDVVAAAESGTIWATQFHPEKSGQTGLALLRRFVEACS